MHYGYKSNNPCFAIRLHHTYRTNDTPNVQFSATIKSGIKNWPIQFWWHFFAITGVSHTTPSPKNCLTLHNRHQCLYIKPEQMMAFCSHQVLQQNSSAINNPHEYMADESWNRANYYLNGAQPSTGAAQWKFSWLMSSVDQSIKVMVDNWFEWWSKTEHCQH